MGPFRPASGRLLTGAARAVRSPARVPPRVEALTRSSPLVVELGEARIRRSRRWSAPGVGPAGVWAEGRPLDEAAGGRGRARSTLGPFCHGLLGLFLTGVFTRSIIDDKCKVRPAVSVGDELQRDSVGQRN